MKKNKLFTLASCACALLLSACSTELDISDNPNHAGAGEAIVTVSLQFPQEDKPAGYAPGDLGDDVLPGVALDAEKEITSIAFIAFTKGGTSVYLSKYPTLSDNGFTEPLTPKDEAVPGEYTAQFKIRSGDFGDKTTIVAIANYAEHGLTFDGTTLTLDGLKKMLSDELLDEVDKNFIKYPLLMSASFENEIIEGSTVPIAFVMERIMARIDVVNNAYDQTTPANGFVLTSARLLSAATQGTMIGGQTGVAPSGHIDLAVQKDVKDKAPADGQPVSPTNPARQQLDPMYVYENSNTDKDDATKLSATATHVEVKGTYKGEAYEKVIEFRTLRKNVGGTIEGGVIVPIARNTRYVVEITTNKENEVEFALKVADWADGGKLDVELDFAEPKLEGLEGFTPGAGAMWDADTKTLDITGATAGSEFNLVVRGNQDSDFALEAEYDENEIPLTKAIIVDRGELSGYADEEVGSLTRTYKITIPQVTGECPSNTKIIVYNVAYADAQTEITVKYAPFFVGDWKKSQEATKIDPTTKFIDLKDVPNGNSGTVSFFASSNSEITTSALTNKGVTPDFYTVNTAEEADITILKKHGPGKRVTLSYKALTDKTEFAEIEVTDASDKPSTKKIFMKCLKNPYALTTTVSPNATHTLIEGTDKLYLAINNGDHGTIDYTIYDDASNTTTLAPTATYATNSTSPNWVQGVAITSNTVAETFSDYNIIKRNVKVSLPTTIKNPAEATNFKVGFANETPLQLIPVYLSGASITATDKAFKPVCVKSVWWSPINVGQTKISVVNDPSSEGGFLFQWGRKQPLTWATPTVAGPLAPDAPEVTEDKHITATASPNDWCNVPNNKLWNSGTDAAPVKVDANDPCPAGWRVPSKDEWAKSIVGTGSPAHVWTVATSPSATQNGLLTVTGESSAKLYFPATGRRIYNGTTNTPGTGGYYWASAVNNTNGSDVFFLDTTVTAANSVRAFGLTVRCVQE